MSEAATTPVVRLDHIARAYRVGSVLCVIGGILVLALLEHVIAQPRTAIAEELAPQPA